MSVSNISGAGAVPPPPSVPGEYGKDSAGGLINAYANQIINDSPNNDFSIGVQSLASFCHVLESVLDPDLKLPGGMTISGGINTILGAIQGYLDNPKIGVQPLMDAIGRFTYSELGPEKPLSSFLAPEASGHNQMSSFMLNLYQGATKYDCQDSEYFLAGFKPLVEMFVNDPSLQPSANNDTDNLTYGISMNCLTNFLESSDPTETYDGFKSEAFAIQGLTTGLSSKPDSAINQKIPLTDYNDMLIFANAANMSLDKYVGLDPVVTDLLRVQIPQLIKTDPVKYDPDGGYVDFTQQIWGFDNSQQEPTLNGFISSIESELTAMGLSETEISQWFPSPLGDNLST
ncbi:MAG: hypothetical protein MRY21_02265 [Simkaniaceae bacterium]|nr:hypothetical protein [Simkaniaceae bacterium]